MSLQHPPQRSDYTQWLEEARPIAGDCEDIRLVEEALASDEDILANPHAPFWAYWLARRLWKAPAPELEPIICRDPLLAAHYWVRVLAQPEWPEGEKAVLQSTEACLYVIEYVKQARWLEAEPTLLAGPLDHAVTYALKWRGRWPELEARLPPMGAAAWRYYAEIGGR